MLKFTRFLGFAATALTLILTVHAHPGHDHTAEAASHAALLAHSPPTISHCAARLKSRGIDSTNLQRRQALVRKLRDERSIADFPLKDRHLLDKSSCTLQPNVDAGPYFVAGELIRQNITDGQAGIPMTLAIQIVDTTTCDPVPNLFLDVWHCNSTGVYGGVVASGNGNPADIGNGRQTFLRGIQETGSTGIVTFNTIFPGHYGGRATHIHLLAHAPNTITTFPNGTLTGLTATHVGQLFFNQSLISSIEANPPYSSNVQPILQNSEDPYLRQEAAAGAAEAYVGYFELGTHPIEGILAWMQVGVNMTEHLQVHSIGTLAG